MSRLATELAVLGALAAAQGPLAEAELARILTASGVSAGDAGGVLTTLDAGGLLTRARGALRLTGVGIGRLLELHAQMEAALETTPRSGQDADCPSIPWLTTVQTEWIEAVSLNYAVDPDRLAALLPAPLAPELWKGSAWVQVLMSSLRDMRPQGLGSLFGVNFYQVSYRAAVRFENAAGAGCRGGYFVRSETNNDVMRFVGNALTEYKFHDFGAAEMVMIRTDDQLTLGVDAARPGGKLVGLIDIAPTETPPVGSTWASLEELKGPLVECYDAYGVDPLARCVYILTIDRGPWHARFVQPRELYCEVFEDGPLADGARLDSVLHIPRCPYRWRPLRREPIVG